MSTSRSWEIRGGWIAIAGERIRLEAIDRYQSGENVLMLTLRSGVTREISIYDHGPPDRTRPYNAAVRELIAALDEHFAASRPNDGNQP